MRDNSFLGSTALSGRATSTFTGTAVTSLCGYRKNGAIIHLSTGTAESFFLHLMMGSDDQTMKNVILRGNPVPNMVPPIYR